MRSISGCSIGVLPVELAFIPDVGMSGNPTVFPPPEVVERGWQAARSFLLEAAHGTSRCDRIKIILIGDTGEGKTSVARAMLWFGGGERGGACPLPDPDRGGRTFGVEMSEVVFAMSIGGLTELKCHMWDFAGQEMYHGTHVLFSSHRTLFFLVVDLSREWSVDRSRR